MSSKRKGVKAYHGDQLMLLPPSLDELIAPPPVRLVSSVIDRINIEVLEAKYQGGGSSAYHPGMLLKVLVYGYLTNIYSSRKLESALKENIHFMWISGMSKPDHNTLARFRSDRLKDDHMLWWSVKTCLQLANQHFLSVHYQYYATPDYY